MLHISQSRRFGAPNPEVRDPCPRARRQAWASHKCTVIQPSDRAAACDWTLIARSNPFFPHVGVTGCQSREQGYDRVQLAAMNFVNSAGLCGLGPLIILGWVKIGGEGGGGKVRDWRLWQTVGAGFHPPMSRKMALHRLFRALWTHGFGTSVVGNLDWLGNPA